VAVNFFFPTASFLRHAPRIECCAVPMHSSSFSFFLLSVTSFLRYGHRVRFKFKLGAYKYCIL
jgi:hypothetical protein